MMKYGGKYFILSVYHFLLIVLMINLIKLLDVRWMDSPSSYNSKIMDYDFFVYLL